MATQTETRTGDCPTHGTVEGTRQLPKMGFPYIVNSVRRALARRKPFRCPECDSVVETD